MMIWWWWWRLLELHTTLFPILYSPFISSQQTVGWCTRYNEARRISSQAEQAKQEASSTVIGAIVVSQSYTSMSESPYPLHLSDQDLQHVALLWGAYFDSGFCGQDPKLQVSHDDDDMMIDDDAASSSWRRCQSCINGILLPLYATRRSLLVSNTFWKHQKVILS